MFEVRRCEGATVRGCAHPPSHDRTVAPSHRSERGFTLVEIMVVMSVIVILASVGLTMYTNSQTSAREAVLKENLFRMRDAIDQYYADKNRYPATLDALVTEKYLRAIPEDPFTNSAETWQTTLSEGDPSNPSAEPGIFDVKSGSERMALDGTMYADW